ncbi:hypothetical protein V5799_022226 [Amblyomma americanum]|uniref:Uncharacterized protein n=1 Tax=Amblyomma americanum TaxID=6943 RepID=A0AAQ4FL25_AMBAM
MQYTAWLCHVYKGCLRLTTLGCPRRLQFPQQIESKIRSTSGRVVPNSTEVLVSTTGQHIAAATVGAMSTFSSGVPVTADCLDLKRAWSLYQMSKAQFFYVRYAYFQCSADEDSGTLVNEPLRLSPDFGLTFQCPLDARAASSIACSNVTQKSMDD